MRRLARITLAACLAAVQASGAGPERGVAAARLEKRTPLEIAFLASYDRSNRLSHELFKWANLPFAENGEHIAAAVREAQAWAKAGSAAARGARRRGRPGRP